MLQDSYKVEKSKADTLNQKLDESENNLKDLDMNWLNLGNSIYTDILIVIGEIDQGKVPFGTIAKELDEMEGKLLTMLELVSIVGPLPEPPRAVDARLNADREYSCANHPRLRTKA